MHLCFTDHILRALSSLQTTEEKLAALCKKYADLHEEHRVLQSTHKQHQRKLAMVHFSLSLLYKKKYFPTCYNIALIYAL